MSALLARLRALVQGLSPSERRLLSIAGVLVLGTLVYAVVVLPLQNARSRATARVETAERELVAVTRLLEQHAEVQARLARVEQRIQAGPRGNIFTLLESLAQRASVKVDSMEPQTSLASDRYRETKVEVVLKKVTLGQAVKYLHEIESAEQLLSVKSLRMRVRRDEPELMDVTFTVSTFEPTA